MSRNASNRREAGMSLYIMFFLYLLKIPLLMPEVPEPEDGDPYGPHMKR